MTQIQENLALRDQLIEEYNAAPSMETWTRYNAARNATFQVARDCGLTRAEYEQFCPLQSQRDDDTLYRFGDRGWWVGDDHLVEAVAHTARVSSLIRERGPRYVPSDFELGLDLVTDGLPGGFREYRQEAQ